MSRPVGESATVVCGRAVSVGSNGTDPQPVFGADVLSPLWNTPGSSQVSKEKIAVWASHEVELMRNGRGVLEAGQEPEEIPSVPRCDSFRHGVRSGSCTLAAGTPQRTTDALVVRLIS